MPLIAGGRNGGRINTAICVPSVHRSPGHSRGEVDYAGTKSTVVERRRKCLVTCHWKMSSPAGPAEQFAGGSFDRSFNSLLMRFKAMVGVPLELSCPVLSEGAEQSRCLQRKDSVVSPLSSRPTLARSVRSHPISFHSPSTLIHSSLNPLLSLDYAFPRITTKPQKVESAGTVAFLAHRLAHTYGESPVTRVITTPLPNPAVRQTFLWLFVWEAVRALLRSRQP